MIVHPLMTFAMLNFSLVADGDLTSGPKAGAPVPPLPLTMMVGEGKTKKVNMPAERQDLLTVYAFIPAAA